VTSKFFSERLGKLGEFAIWKSDQGIAMNAPDRARQRQKRARSSVERDRRRIDNNIGAS